MHLHKRSQASHPGPDWMHEVPPDLYPRQLISPRYLGTAGSCKRPEPGFYYYVDDWESDYPISFGLEVVRHVPRRRNKQVPTALYRLFDTEGRLLYAGISDDPDRRWRQHADDKSWWPQVASKTVEWFDTEPEARAAETAAIKTELPVHNKSNAASPMSLSATWQQAEVERSYAKGAPSLIRQVTDVLRAEILAGYMKPGDRLLSRSEMADHLGVSAMTCTLAAQALATEGLVRPQGLRGVYLNAYEPDRCD
ncbi:GntR family transcriptional regulator [Streptomyces sp. NPDC007044]|uniref:GntR family transcriptional regulator n=1 Tax=Streptomyces sp. NPDC007044 TaxID=3156911 RepID=UPI003452E420